MLKVQGGERPRSARARATPTSRATSPGWQSASTSIARADFADGTDDVVEHVRGVRRRVEPPPRRGRGRRAAPAGAPARSGSRPLSAGRHLRLRPVDRAAGQQRGDHRLHRQRPAAGAADARTTATTAAPSAGAGPPAEDLGQQRLGDRHRCGHRRQGGMLVANPHFPWEGELRFWEVHLTVPGEVDIYGAQLSGCPAWASASPTSSPGPTPCRPATASPPTRSTSIPADPTTLPRRRRVAGR